MPERGGIEHAQQLGLGRWAHFSDLVEEDGSAVGDFEQSGLGAVCSGECAALVAEQFALQQAFLQRGTLDHHERSRPAGAASVNQLGHPFLSRARLAGDEHGRIAGGHPIDQIQQAAEFRAVANEGIAGIRWSQNAIEKIRALAERSPLEGPLNANLEFIQRARLHHVIEGADADRFDGGIDGTVSGQHDDLGGGRGGLDGLQGFDPVHRGQVQVEQNDFGFRGGDSLDRLLPRSHRVHFVPETTQFAGHHLAECGIVIDQKERGELHCPSFGCGCGPESIAGITTSNIDPLPGILSTTMLPPQLRTAFSDRNRPRPLPPWRRLKKGSKIF